MDNNKITIYKNFISFDSEIKALKYVENALNFMNTQKKEKHKAFIFHDEEYSSTVELSSLVHRVIKKLKENKKNHLKIYFHGFFNIS
jgi:hypothetical protein